MAAPTYKEFFGNERPATAKAPSYKEFFGGGSASPSKSAPAARMVTGVPYRAPDEVRQTEYARQVKMGAPEGYAKAVAAAAAVSAQSRIRKARAATYKAGLGMGLSATDAQSRADAMLANNGLPTGQQMQTATDVRSVAKRFDNLDRDSIRFTAPFVSTLGSMVDYLPGEAPSKPYRDAMELQKSEAIQQSDDWTGAVAGLAGNILDPVWLATYGAGRMALADKFRKTKPWQAEIAKDAIAGAGASTLTTSIVTRGDIEATAQAAAIETGGAVVGGLAFRGIGKLWKLAFPDRPLPRQASEAAKVMDAELPGWKDYTARLDADDSAENLRILRSELEARRADRGVATEKAEAERVALQREADLKADQQAEITGVSTGLERFRAREARRQKMLNPRPAELPLPRPEVEADVAARAVDQSDLIREAEQLADPDEIDALIAEGMSREDALRLAVPEVDIPVVSRRGVDVAPVKDSPEPTIKQDLKVAEDAPVVKESLTHPPATRSKTTGTANKDQLNQNIVKPLARTPGAKTEIGYGGDSNGFRIFTPDGAEVIGRVRGADFPGDAESPIRGEIFIVKVPPAKQRKGVATNLVKDAVRLMSDNGVTSVRVTAPSKVGSKLFDRLEESGVVGKKIRQSASGTAEFDIRRSTTGTAPVEQGAFTAAELSPIAVRIGNAYDNWADTIHSMTGASREDAMALLDFYKKKKMVKLDAPGGRFNVKHGSMMDPAFVKRMIKELKSPPAVTPTPATRSETTGTAPVEQADVQQWSGELKSGEVAVHNGYTSSNDMTRLGYKRVAVASSPDKAIESAKKYAADHPTESVAVIQHSGEVWSATYEAAQSAARKNQIAGLGYAEVKELAKKVGVPASGKRQDIVDRIIEKMRSVDAGRGEAFPTAKEPLTPTPATRSETTGGGNAKSRGTTTLLPDLVNAGLKSGKWATQHTLAAARWAFDTLGDGVRSMGEFARAMIGRFGRAIRQHIPAAWQRFKKMVAQNNEYRQRTMRLRTKGGIDLRKKQAPPAKPADPALTTPRDFAQDSFGTKALSRLYGVKQSIDNVIDVAADRLYKVSPRLYNRVYRYKTEANITTHEYRSIMDPIMNDPLVKKLPQDQRNRIKSALLNADPDEFAQIAAALGGDRQAKLLEMVTEGRRIYNTLYDEAEAVGYDPGFHENYWSRAIKPGELPALRKKLHKGEVSEIDDAIKLVALRDYGTSDINMVPIDERAAITARVLAGGGPRPIDSSLPGPLKERKVKRIPDELLQHYEDFDAAVDLYIQRMSNNIAKRRMMGGNKTTDLNNAANLNSSLAKMIQEEGIVGDKANEVTGIIQALLRGEQSSVGYVTKLARDGTYILTMGQVTSAIRQLGDLVTSGVINGPVNTIRGAYRTVLGQNQVPLIELGLDRIAEEYSSRGSSKAVDFIFKITGMDFMDRKIIKNAAIEASLIRGQRKAKANPDALIKELTPEFGAEDAAKLVDDLKTGHFSDNVYVYLTSRLGDLQPVSGLEVPIGYLNARGMKLGPAFDGLPVLMYQLKTFAIRRLSLVRRQGLHEMAKGLQMVAAGNTEEGSKRFLKGAGITSAMVGLFVAGDAAVDQAISAVFDEGDTIPDSLADAALQLMLTSRYAVDQTKISGSSGAAAQLLPASSTTLWQFFTDAQRAADGKSVKSLRKIPHIRTIERFMELGGMDDAVEIGEQIGAFRPNDSDNTGGRSDRPARPAHPSRPARPER